MANEIKIVNSISVSNGNFLFPKIGGSEIRCDQAAPGGGGPSYVKVGTSEEDIAIPDVATLGWCWMKNLDTTNYIKWGPKSGGAMVELGRLMPGKTALLQLAPGITLRAIANGAECKLQIHVFEA